jgi:metal-responsive CopG/Arc/MetJ family transcriptional regulator
VKTITIKLPEEKIRELNIFIHKKHYPSKSEFIRNLIIEKVETVKRDEWLAIAEKSLAKDWLSKEDEKAWKNL